MVNSSVVQLGRYPFSKVRLALLIRTRSPTWNLGDVSGLPGLPYKVFQTLSTFRALTCAGAL